MTFDIELATLKDITNAKQKVQRRPLNKNLHRRCVFENVTFHYSWPFYIHLFVVNLSQALLFLQCSRHSGDRLTFGYVFL